MAKIYFFFLCCCCSLSGLAQCGHSAILRARTNYSLGNLDSCIRALSYCINNNGFEDNDRVEAYKIISECYLALDSFELADQNIQNLLIQKNNFEADDRDPERFKLALLKIKSNLQQNSISSVSKRSESLEKAPATIMVISDDELKRRGYQNLEAVFSDLPGFDISRTNGISDATLYMRGYRSSALTDRILLLIDGVEDNELWTNSAFISMQYPLSNIKRIEIIYGPASTIYGANAFSGVINVVTKDQGDYFPDALLLANHFDKTSVSTSVNTGIGSYGTKYLDATMAYKQKEVFFTLTGRYYFSNEYDLSKYPNWDGKVSTSLDLYRQRFPGQPDTLIKRAQNLDQRFFNDVSKAGLTKYTNPTKDYFINGKFHIGDFKIGFELWNIHEGSSSDFVDANNAVNGNFTHWQVRLYNVNASFSKNLTNKLSIAISSFYKNSQHGPDAETTSFNSYLNNLTLSDLRASKVPFYSTNYYLSQNNQFRTEVISNYTINKSLNFNGGAEFRNGILQGNYLRSNNSSIMTDGLLPDSLNGGNNYSTTTTSIFGQANLSNQHYKVDLNAGGRFDYNTFRGSLGYGGVFNPRIALVYYPGKLITKLIYAEAFEDASSFNKFSTSSTRLITNPYLRPERIKNIEFNLHYNFNKNNYVEIAGYKASYTSILQAVSVLLANGQATTQFKNSGKASIVGTQIVGQTKLAKNLFFYFNSTITIPELKKHDGQDSVRIGDIANFSVYGGVNWNSLNNKVNLNINSNWVGNKPTGANTSVSTNPFTKINGYCIFNTSLTLYVSRNLKVQLTCKNLFNTYYESPGIRTADNVSYSASVPQPSRTYGLNIYYSISTNNHGKEKRD